MDEIRSWLEAEGTGHYFFIAFPVALVVLLILLRGRRVRFVIPALLMSLVIVNPWFYKYWDGLELYAYWRILWAVPVLAVIAALIPAIAEKTDKVWIKGILAAAGVGLVVFGGTFLYKGAGGTFTLPAYNAAKLPEYAVEVADYLVTLDEHPRAVVQHPIGVYMRQYTGDIDIMYGRNIDGYIQRADSEAQAVHNQLNDQEGDMELVATTLANNDFEYLVLKDEEKEHDLAQAGFVHLESISDYGVYETRSIPNVVKEKNELGQVISVTMVDGEGNPVNGEGGYARVTYDYDSNGNISYEFRSDVDGNGKADRFGIAGYEREYDQQGRMLMERSIGPDGASVVNAAGYAQFRRVYRDNNIVREAYFDEKGRPVNRTDTLYASVRTEYDHNHRRIESRYYNVEEQPTACAYGYERIAWSYDSDYTNSEAYFDADGNPVLYKGYASITHGYDESWRLISESYYDTEGRLTNSLNGYATMIRSYDAQSNIVREAFLDQDGNLIVAPMGYAEVRRAYEGTKLVHEAYFGTDNRPLQQPAGHVAFAQEWDGEQLVSRTYLDAEDLPMLRIDGYSRAVWTQDVHGTWNMRFEDLDGNEIPLEGINLVRDVSYGLDGWSEWMTPVPNVENSCFNIGYTNLGTKQEGDIYSCRAEIEFRNVTAAENHEIWMRAQGAQDGKWVTGNVWDGSLVNLRQPPADGIYRFAASVALTEGMVDISTFSIGFRCDYWGSGSFRVRNIVIEKDRGYTSEASEVWSPGI